MNMNTTNEIKGYVHSIESFGSVDGPGVRFIIFLQGCKMRCQYCHNPDTWKMPNETTKEVTPEGMLKQALHYRTYWKNKGGITVSGGEALLQIDFVTELFRLAKEKGINTCLDTSGFVFTKENPFFSKFEELMKYTDLLLVDIKHIDDEKHKEITGWSNKGILEMTDYLSQINKPIWIRHVLVPGLTDNDEDLKRLDAYIKTLKNVERVEVLPYHTLGTFKWKELGIPYKLEGVSAPTKERIENANALLHTSEYKEK